MKKVLYSMLGLGLLLTSCQSDEPFAPGESGEKQVTFTLNVPGDLGTRAGATDNNSAVGGFSNGQGTLSYTLVLTANGDSQTLTATGEDKEVVFTPTVVLGREYKVTAYAHFGDALTDLTNIVETKGINDESKDAYTWTGNINFATDGTEQELTLTRPYGKLRLIATDYNVEANNSKPITDVKSVTVTYNNDMYTVYNAVNGEFTTAAEKSFTNVWNKDYYEAATTEGAKTIFADYVSVNETGVAPFTITVEYGNGETYTREFAEDIPVKRNALTTLKGNFFTAGAEITVKVDEDFENSTLIEEIVKITNAAELQAAINNAKDNTVIYFDDDIKGNVTVVQRNGIDLTIDGSGKKYDGVITVNGDGGSTRLETLTFKNINFYTESTAEFTFIDAPSKIDSKYNYSHNVTIENCNFESKNPFTTVEIGSASFTGTYNLVMRNCTAKNMHSMIQVQSCDNTALVENVTTIDCKNGVSFGNTANPILKNSTINADVYGVRGDGNASRGNLVIENTNIEANQPVIIRKVTTDGYSVALNNATLKTEELYQVVFTSGSDDVAYAVPTCTYSITGAEDYNVWPLQPGATIKVKSADQLAKAVADGATNVYLKDGEYDVYGCGGKTLTLNGSKNAILKLKNEGEEGCDYAFGGNGTGVGDITFNGLTIDTQANTGSYKGFAYMKGTFNDCNFVGAYSLNNANDFVFNRCTFDFKNGYFWTWGANSVKFDGCTFNGNSKCILAHGYASTVININNCAFAATENGYTSSGDRTAAVEIDPAGSNTYTINFTGTNTKTEYYSGWTRVKDSSTGHTITGL